jgi:hypothetical protein
MTSLTPNPTNDWRAQRSLYMGSNTTPKYQCQVLFSPFDQAMTTPMGPVISSPIMPPIEQTHNLPGRVLYPSLSYNYGNP